MNLLFRSFFCPLDSAAQGGRTTRPDRELFIYGELLHERFTNLFFTGKCYTNKDLCKERNKAE